jgi:GNAT superfamily N-acetyltransferase
MTATKPEVTIRVAGSADAGALRPLFESFFQQHLESSGTEEIAANLERARPVDIVFIALVGGQAAGFASLRLLPMIESKRPHAELSDIFVVESLRRNRVGAALVHAVEGYARERGATRISLLTGFDNDEAQAFYRSLGYENHALAMHKGLAEDLPRRT